MSQFSRDGVRLATLVCVLLSLFTSIAAALVFHRSDAHDSVYGLANLVGGTTDSMLHGRGLTVATNAQGTAEPLLYHAARMPVATLVVALGASLFGDHGMRSIAVFKTVLFLLPVWLAMALTLRSPCTRRQIMAKSALLLLPFAALPFMADVVNLQVEEGYSYATLAYSFALLLFKPASKDAGTLLTGFAIPFALAVDLLYLSKSSMWPAVAVLLVFALWRIQVFTPNLVLVLLVAAAPIGWAVHQKAVSDRASIGTSLDGLNLHKGENTRFLQRYPPAPGDSLDRYDADLSGSNTFASEWAFNDFHQHAALDFIRQSPKDAALGSLRKATIFFFSLRKVGSSEPSGRAMAILETFGILLMRLALWTALALAVNRVARRRDRFPALLFLLLVMACAVPYLLGFAYTRHVSILLYPSILLLCRFLAPLRDGAAV